jgi:hypothetical protein
MADRADLPEPASRGATLVAAFCSQCRGIRSPKSHTAQRWRPAFRRMLEHVDRSAMMMPGSGMMHAMPIGMPGARVPTQPEAEAVGRRRRGLRIPSGHEGKFDDGVAAPGPPAEAPFLAQSLLPHEARVVL